MHYPTGTIVHGLYHTSCGALAGTRNNSMGPPHEGSIRRPTAPWLLIYLFCEDVGADGRRPPPRRRRAGRRRSSWRATPRRWPAHCRRGPGTPSAPAGGSRGSALSRSPGQPPQRLPPSWECTYLWCKCKADSFRNVKKYIIYLSCSLSLTEMVFNNNKNHKRSDLLCLNE